MMGGLKNPVLWLVLVFAAPWLWGLGWVLLLTGLAVTSHIEHEQKVVQQAQDFQARLNHPLGTVEIKQHRQFGLVGNGNHCSYFVGAIREFAGDRANIQAAYANQFVELEFLENGHFSRRVPFGLGDLSRWPMAYDRPQVIAPPATALQKWYLVYELDFDIEAESGGDLRCT
jgi:hypothetical protein